MATEQEQPKRKRGRAAGAKTSSSTETDAQTVGAQASGADGPQRAEDGAPDSGGSEQSQKTARGGQAGRQTSSETGQPPSIGSADFGRLLQEQIAQAIQPVLLDFRQQLASAVQHEVEEVNSEEAEGGTSQPGSESQQEENPPAAAQAPTQATQEETESGPGRSAQQEAHSEAEAERAGAAQSTPEAPESASAEKPSPSSPQATQTPTQEHADSAGSEATGQASEGTEPAQGEDSGESQEGGLVKGGLRPALQSTLNFVEQQAENLLQSALTGAISALLAESTRAAVERGAEQGIRLALEKTATALGDNSTVREIRTQTESTLLAIVRDALDAVYAESLRANMQQHAEGASRELLHGNVGGALGEVGDVLQAMLREIVVVLRRQWHRLLRLLLKVILAALDDAPVSEKASLPKTAGKIGESAGA